MAQTPEENARTMLQAPVTSAAAAAPVAGKHEGHWYLHHIALPSGLGDFTYEAPGVHRGGTVPARRTG